MQLSNSTHICRRYIEYVEKCFGVVWKRGFFKWKNGFENLNIMTSLMKASGFDLPVNPVLGKCTVFVRNIHNSQAQCLQNIVLLK
jgi:hypothetical protein